MKSGFYEYWTFLYGISNYSFVSFGVLVNEPVKQLLVILTECIQYG